MIERHNRGSLDLRNAQNLAFNILRFSLRYVIQRKYAIEFTLFNLLNVRIRLDDFPDLSSVSNTM